LRVLDGSLPEHSKFGRSVNFFAPAGELKYWVRASTLPFGFFFYYTLDMAICPYVVSIFGMPIWHPNDEKEVDELLGAAVGV
jgi:Na+/H+-dicarboxylate symporter